MLLCVCMSGCITKDHCSADNQRDYGKCDLQNVCHFLFGILARLMKVLFFFQNKIWRWKGKKRKTKLFHALLDKRNEFRLGICVAVIARKMSQ